MSNFIDSLISWVHLFPESYLSDTDNIVPFENIILLLVIKIKERRAG